MTKGNIVVGALSILAGSACSSEVATTASSEAKEPTTTYAAPISAPAKPDGTPAAGDPSLRQPNIQTTFIPLLDWGFEPASPDCNGWPLIGADSSIRAIPAKTGYYSCKVCSNGTTSALGVTRTLGTVPPGNYTLSAYVRKRADSAAPAQAIARIDGAGTVTSDPVDVREEWDRVTTQIVLKESTSYLKITIGSDNAEADHCLFVDDVVFTRLE